mgnify:CR=1 FL=1
MLHELPEQVIFDLENKFDEACLTGESEKELVDIGHFENKVFGVNGYGGSSYIRMPFISHCVLNVENYDNQCFKWAIISAFINRWYTTQHRYDMEQGYNLHHPERVTSYTPYMDYINSVFDFSNVVWPMEVRDINRFEKKNNIIINVFGIKCIDPNSDRRQGYKSFPIYISTESLISKAWMNKGIEPLTFYY